jgi:DNA-binding phage protein
MPDDSQKSTKRQDWDRNHTAITEAYITLVQELKRPPTQTQIAERCQLSRESINKHLKELKLDDVTPDIKLHTQRVLLGLTKKAETGDAPAVKLWMQLVHGWVETTKHSGVIGTFDSTKCSMTQLERIANGEDPTLVLQNTLN